MLATILHGMQGTPYIYQGEELGMTNVRFEDISQYQDIEIRNMYKERLEKGYKKADIMESIYAKGRDNARTPMQWTAGTNAGFTEGKPWLEINPNYIEINAEEELKNPDSVFQYYKQLIALRKEHEIFAEGSFRLLLKEDKNIFAYEREYKGRKLLVAGNFTEKEVPCPLLKEWEGAEFLIHNYKDDTEKALRPYEAFMKLK